MLAAAPQPESKSLYDLTAHFSHLMGLVSAAYGEITPEVEAELAKFDSAIAEKIDDYKFVMNKLEFESQFWTEEAKARQKIAKACDLIQQKMKERLIAAMQTMGMDEIQGDAYRAKLTPTKGRLVIDVAKLPDDFKTPVVTMEPEKEKIRIALENFEEVPGAMLEGGVSLRFYSSRR